MKKIILPTSKSKEVILTSRVYNGLGIEQLIMLAITEEDEKVLEAKQTLKIDNHEITPDKVYIFGEVNLNTRSKDYLLLERMKLSNFSITKGQKIPNNYDYKEHCCYVAKDKIKTFINSPTLQMDGIDWITTENIAEVIQYSHGLIGKPVRICIFTDFKYTSGKYKQK